MSYILDALKKSEQERGHGNIPDVQTVHSSGLNYQKQKKTYWPYFLIVAVLLNFSAIAYFIVNKENVSSDTSQPDTASTVIEETISKSSFAENTTNNISGEQTEAAKKLSTKKTITSKNIVKEPQVQAKETKPVKKERSIITYQEKVKSVTESSNNNLIDFNELPESVRLQLPTITVSAHVYSSNAALRSIVINNNFMAEGEYLIDGLVLYEITPDGAIFLYQEYLFSYSVVSGWQ